MEWDKTELEILRDECVDAGEEEVGQLLDRTLAHINELESELSKARVEAIEAQEDRLDRN